MLRIGIVTAIMVAGCAADHGSAGDSGSPVHSCAEALAVTHTCLPYSFDTGIPCDGFTTCGPCPCSATCSGGTLRTQQSGVACRLLDDTGPAPEASMIDGGSR